MISANTDRIRPAAQKAIEGDAEPLANELRAMRELIDGSQRRAASREDYGLALLMVMFQSLTHVVEVLAKDAASRRC